MNSLRRRAVRRIMATRRDARRREAKRRRRRDRECARGWRRHSGLLIDDARRRNNFSARSADTSDRRSVGAVGIHFADVSQSPRDLHLRILVAATARPTWLAIASPRSSSSHTLRRYHTTTVSKMAAISASMSLSAVANKRAAVRSTKRCVARAISGARGDDDVFPPSRDRSRLLVRPPRAVAGTRASRVARRRAIERRAGDGRGTRLGVSPSPSRGRSISSRRAARASAARSVPRATSARPPSASTRYRRRRSSGRRR